MFVFLSLLGWGFLCFMAHKNPITGVSSWERGGGGDEEESQPQITWSQSPEYQKQMELFTKYQEPYMAEKFKTFGGTDGFQGTEQLTRSLGGMLGEDIKNPLSLPEDVWSGLWTKAREKTLGEYKPIEQAATERFAGSGMMGSGPSQKYFQGLDISKAKSLEDMAIDMSIQEWTEKKAAKQSAYTNMQNYLNMFSPNFNLPMPTSQQITTMPEEGQDYSGLGMGLGALGGGLLGLAGGPLGVAVGAGVGGMFGSGVGGMF